MKSLILVTLIFGIGTSGLAKEAEKKGLLPELQINSTDEEENQKKALKSEILISKSEKQAINALINVIKKKKGTAQEPDLWFRLAELYMRRSKSGRFFDLNRDGDSAVRFAPPEIREETAVSSLKRAIQIYTKIEKEFPKMRNMDEVIFNNAFANHQIGLKNNAKELYARMVDRHPRSVLVPDAQLAMGELKYEEQDFKGALDHFLKIEAFPNAKVYSYGLYKAAWTLYNLRRNQDAIDKLIQVVKYHDPEKTEGRKVNHNLRAESIRDLALFFGEIHPADKAYSFFAKVCSPDELGDAMINMGKIYLSHSRMKEMNVFLSEFNKRHPNARHLAKSHLLMIEGNELLKNRKEVINQMEQVADICMPDSEWRKKNVETATEACDYDVPKVTMDIARKWWELWLKNKQHKEIAELTQKAFRIHLRREDPAKPDIKSRYAYSELLFQLEDFREASKQYALVGEKTADTTIKHDANYAALVSLEKASAKKKLKEDDAEMIRLAKNYLEKHPNGVQSTQVKFKVGFISYELGQHEEAEKWLRPIAADGKAGDFQRKSEDLILDILNARKDYVAIKKFAGEIAGHTKDEARKKNLLKIAQEADYADIQKMAEDKDKAPAIERLLKFHAENKTSSKLSKDALWQALSLSLSSGRIVDGADLARQYVDAYPDDKRSLDALKDAAKNYADTGFLLQAAQTMEMIAEKSEKDREVYIEAASEIYLLEGMKKQSREFLRRLMTDKNKTNHGKLLTKLLSTMKGEEASAEYRKIEEQIAALGHEPFASELRLRKVQELLKKKNLTEAFNSAKSLVSSKADDSIRARARLVQAEVLEKEFISTGTKTNLDKLSLILGIKTEKLDKAQSAYLEAARMTKDPNVKLSALQGLNRIYTNYVDTVGSVAVKDKLTEDDKKALAAELTKLTKPIQDKKDDTDKKLQALAKDAKAASSTETDFVNLPEKETVKPFIPNLPESEVALFIPAIHSDPNDIARFEASSRDKCEGEVVKGDSLRIVSEKLNRCLSVNKLPEADKLAQWISRNEPQLYLGTLYMSIIADLRGQIEKSLWLADLSLKKSQSAAALYQKAHALYRIQDFAGANALFMKAAELGLKSREVLLTKGLLSFAGGDCLGMLEVFETLEEGLQVRYGLVPAMGECYALNGDTERAVKFMDGILKSKKDLTTGWLQLARIHEIFRFDSNKAISAYESALRTAKAVEMKDWITRKIGYLKGGSKVSARHSQADAQGGQL